jgi:hypothetical protein
MFVQLAISGSEGEDLMQAICCQDVDLLIPINVTLIRDVSWGV